MAEVDRLIDEMLRATLPHEIARAQHKAALWVRTHPGDRKKVAQAGEQLDRMAMKS